jgi:CheY-like chemotaxis protein
MKNVLIVDDSRSILSIVTKEIVRVVDANIVTAKSLQETLKIIEEIDFHIAVIDVNLPDSEHGEVIDLMLEKDVPVVVLAGSMDTKTKKIILEKSILEYVVKTDRSTIVYTANIVKRILKNYDEYVLLVDDTKTSRMFLRMFSKTSRECILKL